MLLPATILLTLLGASPIVCAALAIQDVSVAAPADTNAVAQYGKLELLVGLAGASATKFFETDPAAGGLDLNATFTSPGGGPSTVNGFYDGANWRVRFTPSQTGAWTFAVRATDASGTANWSGGAFTCAASAAPGFALIDGRSFKFSNGMPYFGVGHNNGWQYNLEDITLTDMAANGENLLCFWMSAPWASNADQSQAPRVPLENMDGGLGNYDQTAAAYLDGLIERADAAGVYLLPCVWTHGQLRQTGTHSWGQGWWDQNPYSTLCSATGFFQTASGAADTPQWHYQKNFYRYVLARWGYSPAIVAWVALAEIDGTTGYAGEGHLANPAQAEAWCAQVRAYFAAHDPYRVNAAGQYPLTVTKTDFSADYATWNSGADLRAADSYVQQYSDTNTALALAEDTRHMRAGGTPAFHTEFGGDLSGGATQPANLHNGIFAGLSAGAALAPLVWCDNGSFPLLSDPVRGAAMRAQLRILSEFAGRLDYLNSPGLAPAALALDAGACRAWGMQADGRGFAWAQNTSGTMGGQTLTVSGLPAGSYQIDWFDLWTSGAQPVSTLTAAAGSDGVLRLAVPALARADIGITFNAAAPSSKVSTLELQNGAAPSKAYAGARDAFISDGSSWWRNGNHWRACPLYVCGKLPSAALLRWDTAAVPADASVLAVDLTLNISNRSARGLDLYGLRRGWTAGATWCACAPGLSWAAPGAQDPSDCDAALLGTLGASARGAVTLHLNADGVALVQRWVSTPADNYGVLLRNPGGAGKFKFSTSRAGIPARRPKLTITYAR